ncbi:unnamed protein product [Lymnaea stagnalis]|uniref:Hydrogen voltage-gated channel 1 n=1 Tax=Lymnaea stagnalis TaxID=6523 RepID=A0AAV2HJX2_LYMST
MKVDAMKDTESYVMDDDEEPKTNRQKLGRIITSTKFMLGVIALVSIDCLIVITETMVVFHLIRLEPTSFRDIVLMIFHVSSVTILSLFMIEIAVRIYVMRLSIFKHKLELFDALVVIVSFCLDIIYLGRDDAANSAGLLILLRLWRVTRILNGIVMSVKKNAENDLRHEKMLREQIEKELEITRKTCLEKDLEISKLQNSLVAFQSGDGPQKQNFEIETPKQETGEPGTPTFPMEATKSSHSTLVNPPV